MKPLHPNIHEMLRMVSDVHGHKEVPENVLYMKKAMSVIESEASSGQYINTHTVTLILCQWIGLLLNQSINDMLHEMCFSFS
jgi:hypothetical protein